MELSELKPVERVVEIVHPSTGEELGIMVTVISFDDPRMNEVKRRIRVQRLEHERRGKPFKADEIDENEMSLLIGSLTGWVWKEGATFHGQKPDFNEKNIREVFKELPWFKKQIEEALADEKGFFRS